MEVKSQKWGPHIHAPLSGQTVSGLLRDDILALVLSLGTHTFFFCSTPKQNYTFYRNLLNPGEQDPSELCQMAKGHFITWLSPPSPSKAFSIWPHLSAHFFQLRPLEASTSFFPL